MQDRLFKVFLGGATYFLLHSQPVFLIHVRDLLSKPCLKITLVFSGYRFRPRIDRSRDSIRYDFH